MIYLDSPNMLVAWVAEGKWMKVEVRGFIDGIEYRSSMETILEAVVERGARKILWDCRKMRVLAPDDQAWAEKDWTPRLMKLSKVRASAVVMPQSMTAQLSLRRVNERTTQLKDQGLTREIFTSLEEATKWLRSVEVPR
jgi:hypothetical protein